MTTTAYRHFREDLIRARNLKTHADTQIEPLKSDLYRSAWMLAVGALDAYFCDAFADILAKILLAKNYQSNIKLNDKINSISLPVSTLLSTQNQRSNWKWRVAARGLVEKDNVLSIKKIKDLFNHIMDDSNKILNQDMAEDWLLNKGARQRILGITAVNYRRLNQTDKNKRKKAMVEKIGERFTQIIQRRHDCIHTCDRPKNSLQPLAAIDVDKAIEDIEFLVTNLDPHINKNLRRHLLSIGCSRTTVRRVNA
ncbi:HEPN domain-containing protein [Methylophilus sp. OH31]|uniref:HEPN domain-containing protein n=1 Tax=Methylophilus sp. OH31 TaxID=1387312 RepID=UPI0004B24ACB|nr:HEPN domain-containing protein [Methylophilus sp. OH31]